MIQIDLLLLGDATDGPVEEVTEVTNLDQAFRLFGGYRYESALITATQTAYTLAAPPWGNRVTPLQYDSDGVLIPRRLFEFAASGQALTWTAVGPDASGTVVFRYPAVPGPTSLLKGITAGRTVNRRTFAMRMDAAASACAQAQSSGFTFLARYPGSRYNGTTIRQSGGTVTIVPAPGTGRQRVYAGMASDLALGAAIRDDFSRGFIPVRVNGAAAPGQLTLEAGTWTLTGGVDGRFTPAGLAAWIADFDLAGIDLLCPVGLQTPDLSGQGILTALADRAYPTLLVAQAPASGVALTGSVNGTRQLVAVAFQTTYDQGTVRERLDDAAPLVAALLAGPVFTGTLQSLPEQPPVPVYDAAGLHALASGGYLCAYRSLSRGWALWQANTGDPRWPVSTVRALQEISRLLFESLEPALGQTVLAAAGLNALLDQGFAQVRGSRIVRWQLQLVGDTLYADVEFVPWGEIRSVSAQIALGSPTGPTPF